MIILVSCSFMIKDKDLKKKKRSKNSFVDFNIVFKDYIPSNKGPTSGRVVTLETGRREVLGSNGRACRPSRSEFSVVFSETRVNTG